MKTFSFSSLLLAGALVATISGCAATGANPQGGTKPSMMMGNDGCACCAMHKGNMPQGMNDKSMGMMQNNASPSQGSMCSPGKDGSGKGGCCGDMGKMAGGGRTCSGMDMKDMSPEMHQQHMEMMKQHHPEMSTGKAAPPPPTR